MSDRKDKSKLINKESLAAGLGKLGNAAKKTGKIAFKLGVATGKATASGAKAAGDAISKITHEANERKREETRRKIAEAIEAAKHQKEEKSSEPVIEEPVIEETSEPEARVEEPIFEELIIEEPSETEAEEEPVIEEPSEPEAEKEPVIERRESRASRNAKLEEEKKSVLRSAKKNKKIVIPAAVLALGVAVFGVCFAMSDAKTFADGSIVNGIDVSGMNVKQTSEAMTQNLNDVDISKDGGKAVNIKTEFNYENKTGTKNLIKLSHMDIRKLLGADLKYKLKLDAVDGRELTAASLKSAFPIEKGETVTQNAYINYDEMKIVDEVQGTDIDYLKLADAVAAQKRIKPEEKEFDFSKEDYIAEPEIVSSDLETELEFAKENLADGMDIINLSGKKVHIGPGALAKIIEYNGGNIRYSKEGAIEVARALSKDYKADRVTVQTQEGKKTLNNYAITGAIDAEKTGKAIVNAAKKGEVARIYADNNQTAELGNHVEVSLTSQTVYLIQDGKVTMKSPVVTGTAGHRTPSGIFSLSWKASPSVLSGKNDDGSEYENPVNFWMPFNGGIGLHDAPWRGAFGGSIYISNGSHGCVNMPYSAAKTVYNAIHSGDIIVVFQ